MNTRGSAVVLGVAALALLAQVSTALGAGTITDLTLSLPAIKTCVVETVTIKGTGGCPSYSVNFGDGNRFVTLAPLRQPTPPFPYTWHHVYSKMGTYQVEATGPGGTCTGIASATVQVAAGPWITSVASFVVFPPSPQATPGSLVIIKGENFGNLPAQVWIHLTDFNGKSVHYQLSQTQNYWGDTFVAGVIPPISGVLDQQGTLTLVAQCGAVSNAWPVQFTAARDFVDLAYTGVPPGHWSPWVECSMSSGVSDHDQCDHQGDNNFPPECMWPSGPGAPWGAVDFGNLEGYHDSGYGFTGNSGIDQYWLDTPLQNGWMLWSTSAEVTVQVSAAGQSTGGQVSVDNYSDPGTSNPTLGVGYHVNNCGAIFYTGHLIITGPVGVPF